MTNHQTYLYWVIGYWLLVILGSLGFGYWNLILQGKRRNTFLKSLKYDKSQKL